MKNSITPNQIKQNNRNLIYRYIYEKRKVSQQDICFDLRLSRPTVTSKLNELEEEGFIEKCGQIDTEYVGRKAAAYSIAASHRVSIGVEILRKEVKMIAIDLYGQKIDRLVSALPYENDETYYKAVSDSILAFINQLGLHDSQILGVGFAIQGLISPDNRSILYGKILAETGLSIDSFSRYLPYPCAFYHDADSAAVSELWTTPDLEDAFYLSIGTHLGAAMISQRTIISGKHGHNATIEHIQMRKDGKPCYCGRRGCMETLCSLSALLKKTESPENFFSELRNGDPECQERWQIYLKDLAESINMLHLVYDTEFILGGYLAPYLIPSDLDILHRHIRANTPFEEASDFLTVSHMPKHNVAIGAALPYIQTYLDHFS